MAPQKIVRIWGLGDIFTFLFVTVSAKFLGCCFEVFLSEAILGSGCLAHVFQVEKVES